MRSAIDGVQNETELADAVDAGAAAVIFRAGQLYPAPCFILPSTAGRLAGMLSPLIEPILATQLTDPDDILELVERSGIFHLQLPMIPPDDLARIRDRLPMSGKILLSFPRPTAGFRDAPVEYYPLADALAVDALRFPASAVDLPPPEGPDWIGAAELRKRSRLPVLLSGGLDAATVEAAAAAVAPFAVSACSRLRDDTGRMSAEAARAFVIAAGRCPGTVGS